MTGEDKMFRGRSFMVFDVESVGLHGESFAVGWVLLEQDEYGKYRQSEEDLAWCSPASLRGGIESHEWVREHCRFAQEPDDRAFCHSPQDVRRRFWGAWETARDQGFYLAADVAWPVEARFLASCVDDDHGAREWGGPYPLVDIHSVVMCTGLSGEEIGERLPDELPVHHPLCDARQSARVLVMALDWLAEYRSLKIKEEL